MKGRKNKRKEEEKRKVSKKERHFIVEEERRMVRVGKKWGTLENRRELRVKSTTSQPEIRNSLAPTTAASKPS